MSTRETIRNSGANINDLAHRRFFAPHPFAQGKSIDEFRDEVLLAIDAARFVHRKNIGVIQRGCAFCFELEASPMLCISKFRGYELDRDGSVEVQIASTINRSHAAFA